MFKKMEKTEMSFETSDLSVDELLEIVKNGKYRSICQVIESSKTPVEVLRVIADDDRIGLVHRLLVNENVDASILDRLAERGIGLEGIVKHKNASADLLERLKTVFNEEGFNPYGYNREGWREGDIPDVDELDYVVRNHIHFEDITVPVNEITGTQYGLDGYNIYGFDMSGYDRDGFARYGDYNTGYVDAEGFNREGIEVREASHFAYSLFGADGIHLKTGTLFDRRGFDVEGFNAEGFNKNGFDREGFDRQGFNEKGIDREGYNRKGWNRELIHKATQSTYDENGFSFFGFDFNGLREDGTDTFGFTADKDRDLSKMFISPSSMYVSPDRFQRHYDGSFYRNLEAEGWLHSFRQGFDTEKGFYGAGVVVHKNTGTIYNEDGFNVFGVNADGISEMGFDVATRIHTETGTIYGPDGFNIFRNEKEVSSIMN